MLTTLAFRHLWVRKLRSMVLLLGFALGVGVMIVLLSVGEAMLAQSRDVSLVGGGEVTVLPLGIDIEAMRTGGLGSMFFGIDRARFLTRQVIGGPRLAGVVAQTSPAIEGKLLYLCRSSAQCRPVPVRAGGELPSRAAALRTALDVRDGEWHDSPADSAYIAPTAQQLYDELDRFHLPSRPDSTWAEWHYFNLVTAPEEWWYVTYMVVGDVGAPDRRWEGRLLVTHRRPDGRYERFASSTPASAVRLDTTRADLTLGDGAVRQRDGVYTLTGAASGAAGTVRLDLRVRPLRNRYFPAVEQRDQGFVSGYVVPGLAATADGIICVSGRCASVRQTPAYHDHNWGVWRNVTWEWGAASGAFSSVLYGGVEGPAGAGIASPLVMALADSLGVRQVLRSDGVTTRGELPAEGPLGAKAPAEFRLRGTRGRDTVLLSVRVEHALATPAAGNHRLVFLQMRGRIALSGRAAGEVVSDTGHGFFETYRRR